MSIPAGANLGLRFCLELAALAVAAYWGWTTGDGVGRWILAIAAPAVIAVIWGLFLAPKRKFDLARPLRFAIEVGVWAAAGVALASSGRTALGVAFFAVAVVSGALNWMWD